ncbi:hypothetical protein BKA57DRAFT_763 [Linnemannia elongata]|nr:hypothetical protein BKA57DRAFT_763 [Linnemannia elongata]
MEQTNLRSISPFILSLLSTYIHFLSLVSLVQYYNPLRPSWSLSFLFVSSSSLLPLTPTSFLFLLLCRSTPPSLLSSFSIDTTALLKQARDTRTFDSFFSFLVPVVVTTISAFPSRPAPITIYNQPSHSSPHSTILLEQEEESYSQETPPLFIFVSSPFPDNKQHQEKALNRRKNNNDKTLCLKE